ncbi:ribosome silencing factor [Ottowia thiooxydans]|uniref:ribosome silencing factor n=1 Tax=Ottowia thiooxydans TaxID=219182 RepID=UPI00040546F3|nr:ribosome silencing factor [Ottowia thiooxydans]
MSETAQKKDILKLQRAIIDGLEDVKAQDIRVFNTEHLSPLFERVLVASGTSNRQTKAIAASVRDKVREAGFPKPRIEGEENGEWIIVDCGAAVAHVMQPVIRQYYNLEEIWGDKPVRLKGPASSSKSAGKRAAEPTPAAKSAPAKKAAAKAPAAKSAPVKAAPAKAAAAKPPAKKAAAAKSPAAKAPASKSPASKAPAAKSPAVKAPAKTAVKATAPAAKKAVAKKAPAKKTSA